ncbi:FMN-binding protein [Natronincola ferrireducens]|uniref:Uncharacterized protein, contains FMN-binding domain n=1 Tax=Natronincola ferrireducens TaxID=393762 RepID=A0A1G8YS56_9FIRM|nr:FMN-binding protein [Natronincola ferrireducens]SDK04850.1 Uncharacterized protein, contains FMN-binding domain [Natronincola ferrireducens]
MKIVKKGLIALLVLSMLLLVACNSQSTGTAESSYKDGTYTGAGTGFGGEMEVEVVIENGSITGLNIISHGETPGISDPAFTGIEEQLLENQDTEEIDAISNATRTSEGLIEAIQDALSKAEN